MKLSLPTSQEGKESNESDEIGPTYATGREGNPRSQKKLALPTPQVGKESKESDETGPAYAAWREGIQGVR